MSSDIHIVTRARDGDRQAFGELVARYRPLVFSLCRSMTRSVADAEDLTHDAFIEAFLKMGGLRDPAAFLPWLRTLTLNLCRMWLREGKRELRGTVDQLQAESEDREALFARLTGGMSLLPVDQQTALLLQYWEGLGYEEIAAFLDVPVGTVMSRLHRAKQGLKRRIEEMSEEEPSMVPDAQFQAALNAEIDLLLSMVAEPDSRERLRVILRHSPERFEQMIAAVDPARIDDLALLLRRLGPAALERALAACFDETAELRIRARALLCRLVGRGPERPRTGKHPELPLRAEAALLLDQLIRGRFTDDDRAQLLIELLSGADDEATGQLLASVLLCYPDAAVPRLLARWKKGAADARIERALCRSGNRLLQAMRRELEEGDETRLLPVLSLLDRFVDGFEHPWLQEADGIKRTLEARARGACFRDEMDTDLLREIEVLVAGTIDRLDDERAASAVRVVGAIGGASALACARAALRRSVPGARLAALKVLRERGHVEAGSEIARLLHDSDASVQRAAVHAAGALCLAETWETVRTFVEGIDKDLARTAVTALGEFGDDRSLEVLKGLTSSRNPALAKAAASALYGGRKARAPTSALTRERLKRVRGDARPPLHISPVAALRGLPELREYEERELTHLIAQVCSDYSATRRYLVMDTSVCLMTRDAGIYRMTAIGEAVWRVEHFIEKNYLASDHAVRA